MRVQDGTTLVADGPFADTEEVSGRFHLLEADDLDAAIAEAGATRRRAPRTLARSSSPRRNRSGGSSGGGSSSSAASRPWA